MKKLLTLMTTTALISLTIPTTINLISSATTAHKEETNNQKNIKTIEHITKLNNNLLNTANKKNNLKDSGKTEFYGYWLYDYIYLSHEATQGLDYAMNQDESSFIQALSDLFPDEVSVVIDAIGALLYGEWISWDVPNLDKGSGVEIQAIAQDDIPYIITSISPQ